jgi:hypothetical protein
MDEYPIDEGDNAGWVEDGDAEGGLDRYYHCKGGELLGSWYVFCLFSVLAAEVKY